MEEEQALSHSFCAPYDTMDCFNYLQPYFALQSKLSIYDIGVTRLEHICGYVKIPLTRSSCGGIGIQIGYDAIHVPKHNSAHHLLTQMVLLVNEIGNKFLCPKSLALESIIGMIARSLRSHFNTNARLPYYSGSSNVYVSGWTPAKAHVESCHAGSFIYVTPRAGDNRFIVLVSAAYCSAKTYSDTLPQLPHCQGNGVGSSKIFRLQGMVTVCNSVTQVLVPRPIFPSLKEGGFPGISMTRCLELELLLETSLVSDYFQRQLIKFERSLRLLSSAPSGHVGFSVTTSSKGGVDVNVGSHTIHVPKNFSVRHPLLQMVLFARKWHGDKFACPKSMAPKIIVKLTGTPCSSPATNEYEAGWVSKKSRSVLRDVVAAISAFLNPKERTGPGNEPVLPVLFDNSINKETTNTVSAMPRPGDDGIAIDSRKHSTRQTKLSNMACVTTMMNAENVPTIAGSLICGTDFRSMLHEQLVVNCPRDDHSINNPHYNGDSEVTSSAKETLFPIVEDYHSDDPDCLDAERVIVKTEEAKLSATWVVATAATHHATGNRALITGFVPQQDDLFVHAADGAPMQVLGCGNVVADDVVLHDVWYVPGLTENLVSVSQLSELNYSVGFGRAGCYIRSVADGELVGLARIGEGGLFEVDFLKV